MTGAMSPHGAGVGQFADQVVGPLLAAVLALVDQQCQACNAPSIQSLSSQIQALIQQYQTAYHDNPEIDLDEHAVSNDLYSQLIAGIQSRAAANSWPAACQGATQP
jgi:hypothetical protein